MERRRVKNPDPTALTVENGENMHFRQPSNLQGDKQNIALLLCLYTLQGIPLGLSSAIPMILQNRGVSYKQQVTSLIPKLLLTLTSRPNSVL